MSRPTSVSPTRPASRSGPIRRGPLPSDRTSVPTRAPTFRLGQLSLVPGLSAALVILCVRRGVVQATATNHFLTDSWTPVDEAAGLVSWSGVRQRVFSPAVGKRPSRRSTRPFCPAGAWSYSATMRRLYSAENVRRTGRPARRARAGCPAGATVGADCAASAAAPEVAVIVMLSSPSARAPASKPASPGVSPQSGG